jgi:hypothetical protein
MILCALYTCDFPRYAARRKLCEVTWAKRIAPPFEFVPVGGEYKYAELPSKTKEMCLRALMAGYEGLYKIDDDVVVKPEKLVVPEFDYGGSILAANWHARDFSFCTGGFYWLSRKAMEIVAEAPLTDDIAEDRWVGSSLLAKGIRPVEMPVATQPCPCGKCKLKPNPEDWMAYILGLRYTEAGFKALEKAEQASSRT